MIQRQKLTPEQRRRSQRNYNLFCAFNGMSYMCLGETVLILLAVRLGAPAYFISMLGAMIFFGYLLLPLGKVMTARVGAARSQAAFWVARNIAALAVAVSVPVYLAGFERTAMTVMLLGAFFFYGMRAAGVVMGQPLIGDITTPEERSRVIASNNGVAYCGNIVALLTISLALYWFDSIWTLAAVVVCGAMLGISSSTYLRRIDETEGIRNSARQPIGRTLLAALKDKTLRKLLCSGFFANLANVMLIPISVLALKRGYGVSDTGALLFALFQFGASAGASYLCGRLSTVIGPRKVLLLAYSLLLAVGFLWVVAPGNFSVFHMGALFLLAGIALVSISNSNSHYFLQSIPGERRVGSSMLIAVITGAGAGITGIPLTGFLLEFAIGRGETPLGGFRLYFALALLLLLPGVWFILRLTPLSLEKRKQNNDQFDPE